MSKLHASLTPEHVRNELASSRDTVTMPNLSTLATSHVGSTVDITSRYVFVN